jgi:hypothetical protein
MMLSKFEAVAILHLHWYVVTSIHGGTQSRPRRWERRNIDKGTHYIYILCLRNFGPLQFLIYYITC